MSTLSETARAVCDLYCYVLVRNRKNIKVGRGNSGHSSGLAELFLVYLEKNERRK